jgi:hypothetical protein
MSEILEAYLESQGQRPVMKFIEPVQSGHKTLVALCDALGITEKRVTHLVIEADVRELTKITATMLMTVPQTDEVCKVIKEYRLEPIPPEYTDCEMNNPKCYSGKISDEPASEPVKFREFT